MTEKDIITPLDYFPGGVPPAQLFKMDYDEVRDLLKSTKRQSWYESTFLGLCLIGLIAYFEAFFKNEFASLINIHPPLLTDFIKQRGDIKVYITDIITFDYEVSNKIGFILSEQYDFGSAKTINGLYGDLIRVTPFSKREQERYNRILEDRNLLVHHGGIFTSRYSRQQIHRQVLKGRVFFDSLVIRKEDFSSHADFLESIVVKTMRNCQKTLSHLIDHSSISLTEEKKKAIHYLIWY